MAYKNKDIKKMIELYKVGNSMEQLGQIFNISRKVVSNILKDNNVKTSRFVTSQDIDKIIKLYKEGYQQEEISKLLKIGRHTISKKLKEAKIEMSRRSKYRISREQLYDLYINQKLSTRDLVPILKMKSTSTVRRFLTKNNIPLRNNFGENNPAWKGGITPENVKIRNSPQMEIWKQTVINRDEYTCQLCGEENKNLEVNHIELFSENVILRFEPNNGITLCADCHRSIRGKEKEIRPIFKKIISKREVSKDQISEIRKRVMSKILLYRNKRWLLENYKEKKIGILSLAKKCNVNYTTILKWIKIYNISLNVNTFAEKDLVEYYLKGLSIEALQKKFKIGPKRVYSILAKKKIPLRHKLAEKDKKNRYQAVANDFKNGMTKQEIKKKYKMGWGTIIKILKQS